MTAGARAGAQPPGALEAGGAAPDGTPGQGAIIGTWRVAEVLGHGPAGALLRATGEGGQLALVRALADAVVEDPALRTRVGGALRDLSAVDHPAVARVLEVGEHEGRLFYALAHPEGPSLEQLLAAGALGPGEAAWLGAALAGGLAALHAAGAAHGGLVAACVHVDPAGAPRLVDLSWSAHLRGSPTPADDIAALGRLVARAAGGGGGPDAALRLGARLGGLVDLLAGEPGRRPAADRAARMLAAAARDLLGPAGAPDGRPAGEGALPPPPPALAARVAACLAGGAGAGAAEAPALGRFGRYLLLAEVARGGMGVVYKARHADFDRVFALKVMLAGALADETARKRFLHEAEAAAGLDHPAIVRVHDCGEVDGRAYLAMDFTEGRPLSQVLRDPAWSLDELVTMFVQVVRAVHYAHARGIVHRDLKPENVLVDAQGAPHVLDFGVAKRIGEGPGELTLSGEVVGTPAYMPPEQAEGRTNDIDTRSDVYALGATLFELVTGGRLPFEGKTVTDTLTRILLEDAPAPSKHRPGLPWELDAVVLKALEKQPERRYQSAAELALDLERYLEGRPILARQASLGYRARKWLARRWRPVAVAALLGCAALLASSWVVVRGRRLERAAEETRREAVARHLTDGEGALAAGRAEDARALFVAALALAPEDARAAVGRERADRLAAEQAARADAERTAAEERRRRDEAEAQAAALIDEGRGRLRAGALEEARKAFERALVFAPLSAEARAGLVEAEAGLKAASARAQERAQLARDAGKAQAHEDAARALLARGDARGAQAELYKALAFGSTEAEALLRSAEERLLAQRQAEADAQAAAEAKRLVREGDRALDDDRPEDALRAYVQALAFDGESQAAQDGLVEVQLRLREREAAVERRARQGRADAQAARGAEALARARRQYREGEDVDAVREGYFEALEAFDRALFVVPEHPRARQAKGEAAREVALILREEGQYELASFVLRLGGVEPDEGAAPELPLDPHLVVVEADKVNVRRAFGGVVRFAPSRAFDALRAWVAARGERFRVVIQVRSEPTASIPPAVHCTGLWVRLEDRQTNTVSPVVRVDFEGGRFARPVTVDARGRIVAPWDRTRELDAARYQARVEQEVRRLVTEAERK